jgi:hypothetical protein
MDQTEYHVPQKTEHDSLFHSPINYTTSHPSVTYTAHMLATGQLHIHLCQWHMYQKIQIN